MSVRYSSDKEINKEINTLMRKGWGIYHGKKHMAVIAPNGKKLTFSSSPRCNYAASHFKCDVRKIEKLIENKE